jgi:serine O-acetyltransferase
VSAEHKRQTEQGTAPSGAVDASTGDPLVGVVDNLLAAQRESQSARRRAQGPLPSRDTIARIVDELRAILFPAHFAAADPSPSALRFFLGAQLERTQQALGEQVRRCLSFTCDHGPAPCAACARAAGEIVTHFSERLPEARRLLESDVQAAFEGDPAARFVDEALLCYPGVTAIIQHRLAHQLYELGVPLLPRMISELAHAATGIDIHPGATIGPSFFIDHGTGVVIGETAAIGARVRLYQGVTLGAKGFPLDEAGHPVKGLLRHPIVEDDVIIYAGATILGRVTIGRGSTIGGNVWVTRSVPPGSRITQAQPRNDLFEGGSGI